MENEDECMHDELDHGICMDCDTDFSDSLIDAAMDRYESWLEDQANGN